MAVLVMIGPRWLEAGADGKRRIDAPGDFVCMEIAAALASGKPLVPLLVGAATMPAAAELPPALAALARRQAVVLADSDWKNDLAGLVASLRRVVAEPDDTAHRWRTATVTAIAVVVLLGGAAAWHFLRPASPPTAATLAAANPLALVAGRWSARVKYDWGDSYDEVFEFSNRGGELHGSASFLTAPLVIEHARLDGDWLRFSTRSQEMLNDSPAREVKHAYSGKITPHGIAFTLETTGGYSIHPPIEFTAQKRPASLPGSTDAGRDGQRAIP
jgi:hypothetical protein